MKIRSVNRLLLIQLVLALLVGLVAGSLPKIVTDLLPKLLVIGILLRRPSARGGECPQSKRKIHPLAGRDDFTGRQNFGISDEDPLR